MKKVIILPAVILVWIFSSGYGALSTALCTSTNVQAAITHCCATTKGSSHSLTNPTENLYAHQSREEQVYRRAHSPVYNIVTSGGGRIMP